MPEMVASFGVCRSGRWVVAFRSRVVLFDPQTDGITELSGPLDQPATVRLNDGKVGPDGCFWVGGRDEIDCWMHAVRKHDDRPLTAERVRQASDLARLACAALDQRQQPRQRGAVAVTSIGEEVLDRLIATTHEIRPPRPR